MANTALELVVARPRNGSKNERTSQTSSQYVNQTDSILNDKLWYQKRSANAFFPWKLEHNDGLNCTYVDAFEDHTHGPDCGHEMVSHEDHFDYVVGTRLHHVVELQNQCCKRGCLGEVMQSTVVDHGYISTRHSPIPPDTGNETEVSDETTTTENEINTLDEAETYAETVRLMSADVVITDIYVAAICCQSEVSLINSVLKNLPGVESVEVTFVTKTVHVKHDLRYTSSTALLSALNGAGLGASIRKQEEKSESAPDTFPYHVLISGILLAISIVPLFFAGVQWLQFVALGAFAVGSTEIIRRCIASLRRFVFDINVLTLAACIGAIALEEYQEAGAIIFLFGLSQWLENRCMYKARNAITSLHELQPEFAVYASTNETIPVEKISVDDVLVIRPGDRVAVDGIIISGSSSLDESMLTGESRPVMKTEGDVVCSGSVNCGNGSLNVRSTSTVANSTVALLSKKVEEAAVSKSKTDRIIETFAKYYTPTVVLVAVAIAALPLIVESLIWREWLMMSLILLVSSCPCALVISTPVATICGISTASHLSILIKGGEALEMLSKLKGVSFDKTGTLTRGNFTVTSIISYSSMSKAEILSLAAQLEAHSSHPLAAAIRSNAAIKGVPYKNNTEHVITVPGGGIISTQGAVNTAGIGNLEMLMDYGFITEYFTDMQSTERKLYTQGKQACFVGSNGVIVGVIVLADTIRDNAASALRTLASMKLKLALLTGDDSSAAQHVADYVNIPANQVYSKLLPEDKATVLRDLQSTIGAIGHVGDGVNDSIALASADVGIAMGIGGSAIAIDAADVALFSNDLSSIPKAITVSQTVTRVIYQNVALAIAIKLLVMVLAVLGKVHLWAAVAADVGSSLLVVLNSLRILNLVPKKTEEKKGKKAIIRDNYKKDDEEIPIIVEMQKLCNCGEEGCR
eukprot:g8953.t1